MTDLAILIIILLVIGFLFRVDFIFYILYMTVGIYLWSIWRAPRALRSVGLQRRYTDHAYLGEKTTITVTATNHSRLPVAWIQLDESIPVQLRTGKKLNLAFRLKGRSSRSFAYEVRSMRRGYYQLGPAQITVGDLFGFKESRKRIGSDYLTVYPRIIPITRVTTKARLPFGNIRSQQRLFRDPSRPIGVREFRQGDSIRHVNWKASAHADGLLVKAFQPSMLLETMIFLNVNALEYSDRNRVDGPEWAITVAASLAAYLANNRQSVGLATNGSDPMITYDQTGGSAATFDEESGRLIPGQQQDRGIIADQSGANFNSSIPPSILPNTGQGQLMTILELLARLEPARSMPLPSWLTSAHTHLSWGVTLLVVSPDADLETCRSLHGLMRRGLNPILVIVEPYIDYSAILRYAKPFGITAVHIGSEQDLRRWIRPDVPKSLSRSS